jgi:hypothetical protein
MLIVATGSLLPSIEDWFGARREMRIIQPLLRELFKRQPEVGVGVRPRGPLPFQVAEQMSLISDGLFLEATEAHMSGQSGQFAAPEQSLPSVPPVEQAQAVARWIHDSGRNGATPARFPGLAWLRQPDGFSDREWILAISREYREIVRTGRRPVSEAQKPAKVAGTAD